MPEEQLPKSFIPSSDQTIGTGEGESPLAPLPEIKVRTMESDLKSLSESGGGAPQGYTPKEKEESLPPFSSSSFAPPEVPATGVELPQQEPQRTEAKKSKKGIFVAVAVFLGALGLAALGYFVLYPLVTRFTGWTSPLAGETGTPPPPSEQEQGTPGGELEPQPQEPPPPPQPAEFSHLSFLRIPADVIEEVNLASLSVAGWKSAFEFSSSDVPIFKEVVLRTTDGNLIVPLEFLGIAFPSLFTPDLAARFDRDATFFVYSNNKGTWPGMIMKASTSEELDTLKTAVASWENRNEFGDLFLTNPGNAGEWKSGTVNGVNTRYRTFSQEGAALNYGWGNTTLIISTSYEGFKEAARRAQ